jgi:sterol desaturase/sphingolipid hydroxylase (fatty acid hydroxylase superfamily)
VSAYTAIILLAFVVAFYFARKHELPHVAFDALFSLLALTGYMVALVSLSQSPLQANVAAATNWLGVRSFLAQHKVVAFFVFLLWTTYITYWTHRIAHKISGLWELHKVHHSATRMTGLSWARVHPIEDFLVTYISILLSVIVLPEIGTRTAALYGLFVILHNVVIHSELKATWGWWSWIFVSPAAHQIHHSTNPAHFNANYGSPFSFWDRLHGTYVDPLKTVAPTSFGVEGMKPASAKMLLWAPVVHCVELILRSLPLRRSPLHAAKQ